LEWREDLVELAAGRADGDSSHADAGSIGTRFYPTATFRCVQALALCDRLGQLQPDMQAMLSKVAETLQRDPTTASQSAIGRDNIFTRSQLLVTLPLLRRFSQPDKLDATINDLQSKIISDLADHEGGVIERGQPPHAYLTFHALRALRHHGTLESSLSKLQPVFDLLRQQLYRLISFKEAGDGARFDPVELGFCALSLAYVWPSTDWLCIQKSLRILCASQSAHGLWPPSRSLKYSGSHSVQVPSIETGLALSEIGHELLLPFLRERDPELANTVMDALCNVMDYVIEHRRFLSIGTTTFDGWCSEWARRSDLVESWATAVTGLFTFSFSQVAGLRIRDALLSDYSCIWPVESLDWESVLETDDIHPIKPFLEDRILAPTAKLGSPPRDGCSIILFGPPGTSKTTLARALARRLRWPVLLLTPGAFVERGFEGIESRAREIFEDLLALERTVILFDECDELFLARDAAGRDSRARTIGSFVTPSMLPRLQALHDRNRVVFVLCTNEYASLDAAILRPGRFDFHIAVGPPEAGCRRAFLETFLPDPLKPVPETLVEMTNRFTYHDLKHLCLSLKSVAGLATKSGAELTELGAAAVKARLPSLSISETRHREFCLNEQPRSSQRSEPDTPARA
jgi:hypothetical protein